MLKLKRKKIGDRSYLLVDAKTGAGIATAAQTGEHGRDNYPWEWSLNTEWIFGRLDLRTGHSVESLRDAVDIIETGVNNYGLYKPVGKVDPFDIKEGQIFRYMVRGFYTHFRATQDAYGDANSNTLIAANDRKGDLVTVQVPQGGTVTLFVEA